VNESGLHYELRRSARRRTLSIEVHPDLRIVVRAPARASERFIAERVAERSAWIRRTLARFHDRGHHSASGLRYVDGEPHAYLGTALPLRIVRGPRSAVTLIGGEMQVCLRDEPAPERVRRALAAWYRERTLEEAAAILAERFGYFRERGYVPPVVRVREMRTRWGSLAGGRRMTLNLSLVRAPRECLEYVVVHELCHLEHRGHGQGFRALMSRLMPDWRERRRLLEASLTTCAMPSLPGRAAFMEPDMGTDGRCSRN
jgi:hypothetical protein